MTGYPGCTFALIFCLRSVHSYKISPPTCFHTMNKNKLSVEYRASFHPSLSCLWAQKLWVTWVLSGGIGLPFYLQASNPQHLTAMGIQFSSNLNVPFYLPAPLILTDASLSRGLGCYRNQTLCVIVNASKNKWSNYKCSFFRALKLYCSIALFA